MKAKVSKVQLSSRLSSTPAILVGQMSSSMMMMMQMLQSSGQMPAQGGMDMPSDLTLEINASHPTIINLNILRKESPAFATEVSQVFLDQVMTSSNIPFDARNSFEQSQSIMEAYLDESLIGTGQKEQVPSQSKATSEDPIIIESVPAEDDD